MKHVTFFLVLLFFFQSIYCSIPIIKTLVGTPYFYGNGILATEAHLRPTSISFSNNVLFIADTDNYVLRKVDHYGIIHTVAGIGGLYGISSDGALANQSLLAAPSSILISPQQEVVFTEQHYTAYGVCGLIRKILANGTLATLAGKSNVENCGLHAGDNGFAKEATRSYPTSLCLSPLGEGFVIDADVSAVRKISVNGTISTVAGIPNQSGFNGDGLLATSTTLYFPSSIHVSNKNEMFIADTYNQVIRKVFSNGTMVIYAGKVYTNGYTGDGKLATLATLDTPRGVTRNDTTGEVFIADFQNSAIRKVSLNGTISTVVKNENIEFPYYITLHSNQVYFIDSSTAVKTFKRGRVEYIAGHKHYSTAIASLLDTSLRSPSYTHVTSKEEIYIADFYNHLIRKCTISNHTCVIIGGLFNSEYNSGEMGHTGDGLLATQARIHYPLGITVSVEGEVYFTEHYANVVRKIHSNGTISTVVGIFDGFYYQPLDPTLSGYALGENGLAIHARMNHPTQVTLSNNQQQLFIIESATCLIRKVNLTSGLIHTVAGSTVQFCEGKFYGEHVLATSIALQVPSSFFLSPITQDLYITSRFNCSIRKVFASNNTIVTIAMLKQEECIAGITSVTEVSATEFLLADRFVVRRLYKNGTSLVIAGTPGVSGNSGEGEVANGNVKFGLIASFFATKNGLFIVDQDNHLIRKVAFQCTNYIIYHPQLSIISSKQILVEIQRNCYEENRMDSNALPLVDVMNSNQQWMQSFALRQWNTKVDVSSYLEDSTLDVMQLNVNMGNGIHPLSVGIIPWSEFTCTSFITNASLHHSYVPLSTVTTLQFRIQVLNVYTQLIERDVIVSSLHIQGLHHSTLYQFSIDTMVEYQTGLQLMSRQPQLVSCTTLTGILPSGTVSNITLHSHTMHWKPVPIAQRGNIPISNLELECLSGNAFQEINQQVVVRIQISYDANENFPNQFLLENLNEYSQFRLRVCSEIGCGPFSQYILNEDYGITPMNANTTAAIVFLILFLLLLILAIIIILILLCVVIVLIVLLLQRGNKQIKEEEELQDTIPQEVLVDISQLDTSQHVILHGSHVMTAQYHQLPVAIKLLPYPKHSNYQSLFHAIKVLLQFRHPNVIQWMGVYDHLHLEMGLVMEYCVNSVNVMQYVCTHRLQWEEKMQLLSGIANGMQFLHSHNIIHGALTCEHILMNTHDVPKLIDFALPINHNTLNLIYTAPELLTHRHSTTDDHRQSLMNSQQQQGQTHSILGDKKSDVYAFAIIMYMILFEQKNPYAPHLGEELIDYLSLGTARPFIDESTIAKDEKWVVELMKQCWSSNIHQRPTFDSICNTLIKYM